jgi:hypothetical protein
MSNPGAAAGVQSSTDCGRGSCHGHIIMTSIEGGDSQAQGLERMKLEFLTAQQRRRDRARQARRRPSDTVDEPLIAHDLVDVASSPSQPEKSIEFDHHRAVAE